MFGYSHDLCASITEMDMSCYCISQPIYPLPGGLERKLQTIKNALSTLLFLCNISFAVSLNCFSICMYFPNALDKGAKIWKHPLQTRPLVTLFHADFTSSGHESRSRLAGSLIILFYLYIILSNDVAVQYFSWLLAA